MGWNGLEWDGMGWNSLAYFQTVLLIGIDFLFKILRIQSELASWILSFFMFDPWHTSSNRDASDGKKPVIS